jgi:hypothetical protein
MVMREVALWGDFQKLAYGDNENNEYRIEVETRTYTNLKQVYLLFTLYEGDIQIDTCIRHAHSFLSYAREEQTQQLTNYFQKIVSERRNYEKEKT